MEVSSQDDILDVMQNESNVTVGIEMDRGNRTSLRDKTSIQARSNIEMDRGNRTSLRDETQYETSVESNSDDVRMEYPVSRDMYIEVEIDEEYEIIAIDRDEDSSISDRTPSHKRMYHRVNDSSSLEEYVNGEY